MKFGVFIFVVGFLVLGVGMNPGLWQCADAGGITDMTPTDASPLPDGVCVPISDDASMVLGLVVGFSFILVGTVMVFESYRSHV
ncbi:hypothetical protein ACEU6E_08045 [Halorutilales archaeon Cl-col2-1]